MLNSIERHHLLIPISTTQVTLAPKGRSDGFARAALWKAVPSRIGFSQQERSRTRLSATGWHVQDIQVIDTDLGRSGATTEERVG